MRVETRHAHTHDESQAEGKCTIFTVKHVIPVSEECEAQKCRLTHFKLVFTELSHFIHEPPTVRVNVYI